MQTKGELIYNDVCTGCIFGCLIYSEWLVNRGDHGLKHFWVYLFVYFLIKQVIAHKEYYKVNNRLF
jgi:hypothetical protein